jgi:hypothetical protein
VRHRGRKADRGAAEGEHAAVGELDPARQGPPALHHLPRPLALACVDVLFRMFYEKRLVVEHQRLGGVEVVEMVVSNDKDIGAPRIFLDPAPALIHLFDLERVRRQAEAHRRKRHARVDEDLHVRRLDKYSGAPDAERFSGKRCDFHTF